MAKPNLPLSAIALLNLRKAGEKGPKALYTAAKACEPVMGLVMARNALGHWPTQAEYAEVAGISERKAQLEWAAFRRGFPDEQSPERYAKLIYAEFGPEVDHDAVYLAPAPPELQPA